MAKKPRQLCVKMALQHSDPIYGANARFAHFVWRNYRYTKIDSLSKDLGHTASDVNTAINDGRMFRNLPSPSY